MQKGHHFCNHEGPWKQQRPEEKESNGDALSLGLPYFLDRIPPFPVSCLEFLSMCHNEIEPRHLIRLVMCSVIRRAMVSWYKQTIWTSRGQHPTPLGRDMELTLVVTLSLHWALPPCAHICMRIIETSVYNHTHACMEVLILYTFYADQRKIFICPHWLGNSAWSQQTKILKTLHLPLGKEKCLILIIWRYFFLIFKNVLNWCLCHSPSLRGYWWWILKNGNQPTSLDLKSMHFCSLLCLEKKR